MKAPSFPFYTNNWLASEHVMSMTPEQEGGYIHLLAIAWNSSDCGLPDDDSALAVLSRLGAKWGKGAGAIIRRCFYAKDGRIYNERLLKCAQEVAEFREKQRQKGLRSGQARHEHMLNRGSTVVQPELNSESESDSESESTPEIEKKEIDTRAGKVPAARTKRQVLLADDSAWFASIKADFAKIGVDADTEAVKAKAWLKSPKGRGRKFTQQFFVNWLSRADRDASTGFQSSHPTEATEKESAILDYTRQAWECITLRKGSGVGDIYRKCRDNFGEDATGRMKAYIEARRKASKEAGQ